MTMQPSATEQYQDVIRYLIQHSQDATMDPALLKVLEYLPRDASADSRMIGLYIAGVLLIFFDFAFIAKYSKEEIR